MKPISVTRLSNVEGTEILKRADAKERTALLIIGVLSLILGFFIAFFAIMTGFDIIYAEGFLLIFIGIASTATSILPKTEMQKDSAKSDLGLALILVGGILLFLAFSAFYYTEMAF